MPSHSLAPDLILVNGRIHNGPPRDTVAVAVAVKDGRFVAVGADDEVRAVAGAGRGSSNTMGRRLRVSR